MGYLYTQISRFWETSLNAIGSHLAISIGGIFFFGFPVAFSLGAYGFAIIAKSGISLWVSVLLTIILSTILGLGYALIYRKLSNDSFAVFTLASVLAFDALLHSWSSLTGGVLGIASVPHPLWANTLLDLIILQGSIALLALLLEYLFLKSPIGRSLQAHKEDRILLESTGVSSNRIGTIVLIFSAISSACAGILAIWRIQFLDPTFGGIPILLQIVTISILAFAPKVRWLAGSTLLVILLPEILRFFQFPSTILGPMRLLVYSILLIFLVRRMSESYTPQRRYI